MGQFRLYVFFRKLDSVVECLGTSRLCPMLGEPWRRKFFLWRYLSFSLGRTQIPCAWKALTFVSHVGRFLAFKVITRLRNVFSQKKAGDRRALSGALWQREAHTRRKIFDSSESAVVLSDGWVCSRMRHHMGYVGSLLAQKTDMSNVISPSKVPTRLIQP
jgi:hypothetical protein